MIKYIDKREAANQCNRKSCVTSATDEFRFLFVLSYCATVRFTPVPLPSLLPLFPLLPRYTHGSLVSKKITISYASIPTTFQITAYNYIGDSRSSRARRKSTPRRHWQRNFAIRRLLIESASLICLQLALHNCHYTRGGVERPHENGPDLLQSRIQLNTAI